MSEGKRLPVRLLALPVGLLLVAGAAGGWWLSRENCRLVLAAHRGPARAVALSADGRLLASGGGRQVRLYDFPGGAARATLDGLPADVTALALSADGSLVAGGGRDGTLTVWTTADRGVQSTLRAHRKAITALLFLADGKTLLSAGQDRSVVFRDRSTGRSTGALPGVQATVWSLAVSADGGLLATGGSDNAVQLWKLPGRTPLRALAGHRDRVLQVVFTGDGRLLSGDRSGVVKLWDAAAGRELASFQGHQERISGLGVAAARVVSASEDRGLARWSLAGLPGEPTRWQQRSPVEALTMTPDGRLAVTAGADGRLRVWDVPQ